MTTRPLVLASQSKGRIAMLQQAGLTIEAIPAHIDEDALTQALLENQASAQEITQSLADQKALVISAQKPDALVIGSDQVLEFNGEILGKAKTADEAIQRLKTMSARTHHLIAAVSLACNNQIIWRACDQASLTMHALDDAFFDDYRRRAAPALTSAVGGYWLEDVGSWLFKEIEGNYFTILGMPLLPLLTELRQHHHKGLTP